MDFVEICKNYGVAPWEVVETLSNAINICDKAGESGTGDRLLDIINIIKESAGIPLDD